MKYKVGDRVRIKSLDWYNENKDRNGNVRCGEWNFTKWYTPYCGAILTIRFIWKDDECYKMIDSDHHWTDEMIEGLVEEEVFIKANDIYNEEYSKGEYCHEQSFKWGFQEGYNYSHENDKLEISLKEGYQFVDENGNVINTTKIVLEKKKKEYPKTYCECKDILGLRDIDDTELGYYKTDLIDKLQMLLICRDAYWKIAGDEMGLGKPWEPDWTIQKLPKYCIAGVEGQIKTAERYIVNTILAFPTAEMRDAFYENFKSEIEICKELL